MWSAADQIGLHKGKQTDWRKELFPAKYLRELYVKMRLNYKLKESLYNPFVLNLSRSILIIRKAGLIVFHTIIQWLKKHYDVTL